jgi:GT2 family glycosyltransferase
MVVLSNIQFVIVLYKCALQNAASFISISKSLKKHVDNKAIRCSLFVYDNSPYLQEFASLESFWDIVYKNDPNNSGLSVAYNQAAEHAKQNNKQFLILLDQDTTFPVNSMDIYMQSINANSDINIFAPILRIANGKIMSPCKYVNKWGKLIDSIASGPNNLDKFVPVNSGLCVNLDSYFIAGGYNEDVKIDGADFQFLERFKKKVGKVFYILDLEVYQDFSLFEIDVNNIMSRFVILLKDVRNFERTGLLDTYFYNRIVLIRALNIFMQTKKPVVFYYYIKYYLNKKSDGKA